jgi:mono/diheme cytochrome c family protein
MMVPKRLLFFFAALMLAPSVASAAPDPVIGRGFVLFMNNNCYLCHGTVGQGGSTGPVIPPPRLFPTFEKFAAWVRKPGIGQMPVYTPAVLVDQDLAAIYAYLKSLPAPSAIK